MSGMADSGSVCTGGRCLPPSDVGPAVVGGASAATSAGVLVLPARLLPTLDPEDLPPQVVNETAAMTNPKTAITRNKNDRDAP
jgi:hypothetical protein